MTIDAGLWQNVIVSVLVILYLQCLSTMDVRPQKEVYTPNYNIYHNLTSLDSTLADIVRRHPMYVKHHPKYVSREGRKQYLMQITNFTTALKSTHEKVNILFSFGEHAREYLPVESLLHLIKTLLNSHSRTDTKHILNEIDLFVVVMANPDGRRLVQTTGNYCWRGTSSGVDLNRNFDWEFGGHGSSSNSKDEEYRGPHSFSDIDNISHQCLSTDDASLHTPPHPNSEGQEPECRVYRNVTEQVKFDLFVSFHSGIRQIYIPYADSKSKLLSREPANHAKMMQLARLLAVSTNHNYQYGGAAHLNDYTADGTVFDYMAGVRKIPFSYAIELWGPDSHKGSSCFNLFNPPSEQLLTVTKEIQPLYMAMFDYMIKWKRKHPEGQMAKGSGIQPYDTDSHSAGGVNNNMIEFPSLTPGYVLLIFLVLITVLVGLHGRYPFCRRIYQRRRVVSLRSLGSTFALY